MSDTGREWSWRCVAVCAVGEKQAPVVDMMFRQNLETGILCLTEQNS